MLSAQSLPDLTATLQALRQGDTTASAETERALAAAAGPACRHAFLATFDEAARRRAADPALAALPLSGLPVSTKDLFDLAGQPTPAGSRVLRDAPPAARDARAVTRLLDAGATLVGRTNMSEFAFSGVGTNPTYGTPVNPADPQVERLPGGSSSGAAVSVATGAAFIGLGSDTGGSIRIPAALCGIVGFKNTARLVPTEGALPLSTTLDTVCALTRSARDAVLAHEVLTASRVIRSAAPLSAYRLAVPSALMLDDLAPSVAAAFDRAIAALRRAGARIDEIELPELRGAAQVQAAGTFAGVESYAWHRDLLAAHGEGYDPRVRQRMERGAAMAAHEYIRMIEARRAWITTMEAAIAGYDALLSPTVPMQAPAIASLAPADGRDPAADAARDAEFFRVNGLLLRNPSAINLLDGCAISLPCHAPGELPVGLMAWHGAMHDDTVLNIGLQLETALAPLRAA